MSNFQPREVVDRGSETQSQVDENLNRYLSWKIVEEDNNPPLGVKRHKRFNFIIYIQYVSQTKHTNMPV